MPKRMIMYVSDIVNITGQKERTARRLFHAIRVKYNVQVRSFIWVKHFCEYTGREEEEVLKMLI